MYVIRYHYMRKYFHVRKTRKIMKTFEPVKPDSDTPLQILVVDDHSLMREALSAALDFEDGLNAQDAASIEVAVTTILETGRFHVVLVDYDTAGMDGQKRLRRLIEANDGAVALVSASTSWLVVERAMDAGAHGFIPKSLPLKTLVRALHLIAAKELYLPGALMLRNSDKSIADLDLKPREMRVLSFLCEGLQNKEIGREIDVGEAVVKMSVKSICQKMGVKNRTQVVIEAMRRGLL